MLVTTYDNAELESVQVFFPKSQQPKAYTVIRDQEIKPEASYREASRTKGRGAKLYRVSTLQEIKKGLDKAHENLLTVLPNGCIDLAGISERYEVDAHRISAGFALVGLEPVSTYRRNGAKRPVNAYDSKAVEFVMSRLHEIRQGLYTYSNPNQLQLEV